MCYHVLAQEYVVYKVLNWFKIGRSIKSLIPKTRDRITTPYIDFPCTLHKYIFSSCSSGAFFEQRARGVSGRGLRTPEEIAPGTGARRRVPPAKKGPRGLLLRPNSRRFCPEGKEDPPGGRRGHFQETKRQTLGQKCHRSSRATCRRGT